MLSQASTLSTSCWTVGLRELGIQMQIPCSEHPDTLGQGISTGKCLRVTLGNVWKQRKSCYN